MRAHDGIYALARILVCVARSNLRSARTSHTWPLAIVRVYVSVCVCGGTEYFDYDATQSDTVRVLSSAPPFATRNRQRPTTSSRTCASHS